MKYKALFLDIDDTLIGSDKQVSSGNYDAIRRAREAGVFVTVATGRGYLASSKIWKAIDMQGPIIVYGGAMIKDTRNDEMLYCGQIQPEIITEALEAAREWGIYAQIFQGDTVLVEEDGEFPRRYTSNMDLPLAIDPALRKKTWYDVPKVLAYAPGEIEQEMVARFQARFQGKLEVASSKPGYIELNQFGVNKGTTMLKLASMYNIAREETVGVGDNTLDLEMIKMAGLGVCVGNGQQVVKDQSDVIAPSADDDGVRWIIDNYFLNA